MRTRCRRTRCGRRKTAIMTSCVRNINPPATSGFRAPDEHAVTVMGIDHVGIGCTSTAGRGLRGLRDVSEYPNVTRALLARGYEPVRQAVGNTLRVLRAQERLLGSAPQRVVAIARFGVRR